LRVLAVIIAISSFASMSRVTPSSTSAASIAVGKEELKVSNKPAKSVKAGNGAKRGREEEGASDAAADVLVPASKKARTQLRFAVTHAARFQCCPCA
jgi:hypothetical protein